MADVVKYYTGPAHHRGRKFYRCTTVAHVPGAPTPALPEVLFPSCESNNG